MRRDALRAACWASIALASSGFCAETKAQTMQANPQPPTNRVQDSGVIFEWRTTATHLQGCMQAKSTGWITVGFNTRPTLDGARLVMGRMDAKSSLIEIHQAMPPRHEMRHSSAVKSEVIQLISSEQRGGLTRICFRMALAASYTGDVALSIGKPVHLILAWSHERDFQHHSAQRGAVNTVL